MNFYDLSTIYEICGQLILPGADAEQFYRAMMKNAAANFTRNRQDYRGLITQFNSCETERSWMRLSKPYYKIHAPLLPLFADTRLDVPAEFLRAPFNAFLIRFPENHQLDFLTASGNEVNTILVHEASSDIIIPASEEDLQCKRQLCLWIDFGERLDMGVDQKQLPVYTYQLLKIFPNDTVEQALQRQRNNIDIESMAYGINIPFEVIEACVRITVATCFLATGGDRIVEPDVLNRDLQKYLELRKQELTTRQKSETINKLHQRAQQRGKRGWVLGREIEFPSAPTSHPGDPTGRQLKYQHQRGAHFHIIRHGPGKTLARIEWFRQTTVKPDLPAPPITTRKGHTTK